MIIGVYSNDPAIILLTLKIFKNLGQTKLITNDKRYLELTDDEGFIEDVEVLNTDYSPDELFVRDKGVFNEDYVIYDIDNYIPHRLDGIIFYKDEDIDKDIINLFDNIADKIIFEKVNEIGLIDTLMNKSGCKITTQSLEHYYQDCVLNKQLVTVKDKLLLKALNYGFIKFLGLKSKCVLKLMETEVY